MSRTQSFPKLVRHLDKSRPLILLSQSYSRCLACQDKMLMTWKLQKGQQANLNEWKFLLLKGSFTSALRTHLLGQEVIWVVFGWCLGQMRASPFYRHLRKFLEPWRVPYKSRRFQNSLHNSMYKPMYKNIQEISRILQKALDSSHAFLQSVEMCGFL